MSLTTFFVIGLIISYVNGQLTALANGCYVESTGLGYACDGKNNVISCRNNQLDPLTTDDCNTADHLGGNSTNNWCYSFDTFQNVCGPSPGICTEEGEFPVTASGVDSCKVYFTCTIIPPGNSNFNQILRGCPPGQNFSIVEGRCVSGPCILTRPTTIAPTTPLANVTTPDPTTSGNVTTPVPTTPSPRCRLWERREDPRSCRRYLICNMFGRFVSRPCSFFRRFDTGSLSCQSARRVNCGSRAR